MIEQIYCYTFEGTGAVTKSTIIILETQEYHALRNAKAWAYKNGLDPESLKRVCCKPIEIGLVVYAHDGNDC